MPFGFPLPEISPETQAFFRIAYGLTLLGTLFRTLPSARRFFMSERWGGFAKSEPLVDCFQNPVVLPFLLAFWFIAAALLTADRMPAAASFANLLISWYFFIWMRWRGVHRGLGAPGFLTYWLALALFLLEYSRRYAPALQPLALFTLQLDFAVIIFSSGFYKFRAGYLQNQGMEFGLVNPQWGYWWKFYQSLPAGHWIFKAYNQLAWSGQIAAALLMIFPATRFWGGALLIASFAVIVFNVRLLFLCPMVMICGLLYFAPGSPGDRLLSRFSFLSSPEISAGPLPFLPFVNEGLKMALILYLVILPFAHAGLFYNFYARKSLPLRFQKILETYTNFFGMIVWRVFSYDLVNFFVRIYRAPRTPKGERSLVSHWDRHTCLRYRHVGEAITVTSLFTTLKYYPSDDSLFRERLARQ